MQFEQSSNAHKMLAFCCVLQTLVCELSYVLLLSHTKLVQDKNNA